MQNGSKHHGETVPAIPPDYLDAKALILAVERSRCVVEFDMTGHVLTANNNFLKVFGYSLDEIVGVSCELFIKAGERGSFAQKELWSGLNKGEFYSGEYRQVGKNDRQVWLQATWNPCVRSERHSIQSCRVCERHHVSEAFIGRLQEPDQGAQRVAGHD